MSTELAFAFPNGRSLESIGVVQIELEVFRLFFKKKKKKLPDFWCSIKKGLSHQNYSFDKNSCFLFFNNKLLMLHPSPMCTAVIAQPWVLPGMSMLSSVSLQFVPVIFLVRSRSCLRRFNWELSTSWDMSVSLCDGDWDQQFAVITLLLIYHYNYRAETCFDIFDWRQQQPFLSVLIQAPDRRTGKSDPIYTEAPGFVAWVTAVWLGLTLSPSLLLPISTGEKSDAPLFWIIVV